MKTQERPTATDAWDLTHAGQSDDHLTPLGVNLVHESGRLASLFQEQSFGHTDNLDEISRITK